jgi:two-component system LytT family response regulator
MLHAFIVDDERLAVERLKRLLKATGRVEVAGSATDPETALAQLQQAPVDVVFLDIQMPGLTGFELLARLEADTLVVFTTAYDQYAIEAFAVNSVDYLLKPIEPARLDRAPGAGTQAGARGVPRRRAHDGAGRGAHQPFRCQGEAHLRRRRRP